MRDSWRLFLSQLGIVGPGVLKWPCLLEVMQLSVSGVACDKRQSLVKNSPMKDPVGSRPIASLLICITFTTSEVVTLFHFQGAAVCAGQTKGVNELANNAKGDRCTYTPVRTSKIETP